MHSKHEPMFNDGELHAIEVLFNIPCVYVVYPDGIAGYNLTHAVAIDLKQRYNRVDDEPSGWDLLIDFGNDDTYTISTDLVYTAQQNAIDAFRRAMKEKVNDEAGL